MLETVSLLEYFARQQLPRQCSPSMVRSFLLPCVFAEAAMQLAKKLRPLDGAPARDQRRRDNDGGGGRSGRGGSGGGGGVSGVDHRQHSIV